MDNSSISKKLKELEMKAGGNDPAIFLIENGKITSSGREYTKAQYEAITARSKTVITIIDNIPDNLEVDNGKN